MENQATGKDSKHNMALLSVDDALARLLAGTSVLASETVPLHEAGGRVLATPVVAVLTQPPFAASAMDGYALHACDIQNTPVRLAIIGEAAAGHAFSGKIGAGEAVRIFTGAPVPDTADTIIVQEKTKRIDDTTVEISESAALNKNIRPVGGDFKQEDTVLPRGQVLTPAALALAAAAGHDAVEVIGRPRVAILSTGDELVPAGTRPGANRIVASNAYGIGEIARLHGTEIINLGIAPDEHKAICRAVDEAIRQKTDILVISGGVSAGDYDLVQDVLKEAGMVPDFWKIAMRPGKPLMSGILPANLPLRVLGLPGNPVSSLVTAHVFLVPVIEKMSGRTYAPQILTASLKSPLAANGSRRHYIRAIAQHDTEGEITVTPLANQDSSLLSVMAQSNCLIVHEADAPEQTKGGRCQILLLEHFPINC